MIAVSITPCKSIRAQEELRARFEWNCVGVDTKGLADPDRHRQHVTHGMSFQLIFADAEPAADLIHPRLVFGDDVEFPAHVDVGSAIAHVCDQHFGAEFPAQQSW